MFLFSYDSFLQNQDFETCYPPLSDSRLTALDLVADSESTDKEEEAAVEETEQSTSKHSKCDRSEDDEVTSKHTSSTGPRPEDIDPRVALDVVPISSRPPKKPCTDTWNLDNMLDDDDDSE